MIDVANNEVGSDNVTMNVYTIRCNIIIISILFKYDRSTTSLITFKIKKIK
jgi:hypothetical protein